MSATPLPPETMAELRPCWDALCEALRHTKRTRDDGLEPLQRSTGDLARAASKLGVPPESFVVMLKRAAFGEGLDSLGQWLVDQFVRWGIESYYGVPTGRARGETLTTEGGQRRTAKLPLALPNPEPFSSGLAHPAHARRLNTPEFSLVVRQVANDARRADIPIELVIIGLKALFDRLSFATDGTRSGRERMHSRQQIVSLAINEYYDTDRS